MALTRVRVKQGEIQGYPAGNQAISVFKGIPYAKPPVGERRWRAPEAAEEWKGVFNAYEFGRIEVQAVRQQNDFYRREFYPFDYPMSENCLYLNVWTPAKNAKEKLPVALWIHGGGMRQGYSNKLETDGEAFAKRWIVYVSLNYRLNIFGFFGHPDLTAEDPFHSSGNYGILDQILALRWIHENIAAFGGDPNCVTIFGQSGGGRSVQALIVSDLTKGMIHRAIMQSAGGLGNETLDNYSLADCEKDGIAFFQHFEIKDVAEARKIPALELHDMFIEYSKLHFGRPSRPCIDGYLWKKDFTSLCLDGDYQDLDYMIGTTKDEDGPAPFDLSMVLEEGRRLYPDQLKKFLKIVTYDDPGECEKIMARNRPDSLLAAALSWSEMTARSGKKPSYQYLFTHVLPGEEDTLFFPLPQDERLGKCFHSSEHMYIQQTFLRSWRPFTGEDFDLSNKMCAYWTNFVKYGNPNEPGLPVWEPYTMENRKVMELSLDPHMIEPPVNEIVAFRRDYPFTRGKKKAK